MNTMVLKWSQILMNKISNNSVTLTLMSFFCLLLTVDVYGATLVEWGGSSIHMKIARIQRGTSIEEYNKKRKPEESSLVIPRSKMKCNTTMRPLRQATF